MALRMMLCGRALGRRLVPLTARCMRTYSSQNRKSIECAKMKCTYVAALSGGGGV